MLWTIDSFAPLVSPLGRTQAFQPATDLSVSDGDLVLTMDLPGLRREDLSIELLDGSLTVRGERRRPDAVTTSHLAHRERAFGAFERRIRVPDGVDPDAIMATMQDGVLSLIVPKPERMKPRTITIGAPAEREQLESRVS